MRHALPRSLIACSAIAVLSGCAALTPPPSAERTASLPVVELGSKPPQGMADGEFIFRIPGGKPIPTQVSIEGSALASGAHQVLNATLPKDLYVYKTWVSDDGRNWKRVSEVLDVKGKMMLPSPESPMGGEIQLKVDRKAEN